MYAWTYSERLTFFIYLQMNPKWDGFYVELAWSSDDKWPGRSVPGRPAQPGEAEGFRRRLEYIIDKKARHSLGWDLIPRPALDNPLGFLYLPPVESAFDKAEEPTLRQLQAATQALGDNAARVQFVYGVEGLYQWMQLFSGRF